MFEYDIVIESPDGHTDRIDWGNHEGWIDEYRDALVHAARLLCVPKDGASLPLVSVTLGEGKRWILFKRTFGEVTGGRTINLYAIGWQSTVNGVSVKSITWIYPNGMIENGETPNYWKGFL